MRLLVDVAVRLMAWTLMLGGLAVIVIIIAAAMQGETTCPNLGCLR